MNNLSYEEFEPRLRSNDIMNISPPSVINVLNVSTGSFTGSSFQGSQTLLSQEVIIKISRQLSIQSSDFVYEIFLYEH